MKWWLKKWFSETVIDLGLHKLEIFHFDLNCLETNYFYTKQVTF